MATEIYIPEEAVIRMELEAQLEKMDRLKQRHSYLKWFDDQLRQLDPFLELVKAAENSNESALIPGFWHIKRNNPTDIPTYYPITTDDGGFIEPHMGVLDDLRKWDTSRPGWFEERKRKEERAREQRQRDAQERRITELAERIDHYETPSVSLMRGKRGWTNSNKGKRGAAK